MKWFYNLTDKARGRTIAASWIPFFLLIVTIDFSNNVLVIITFLALIPPIFLSALVIVEALKAKIQAAIEEDRKRKQETREMQEQLRKTQENIRDMMVRLEKLREKTLAEEKASECSREEPKE